MDPVSLISAIGFPILLAAGSVLAWRATRKQRVTEDETEKAGWRDDSLDAWRKERDAAAEEQRATRASEPKAPGHESLGGDDGETKRHQRIGG